MSTNNKKSVAAQALLDVENIKESLKEESKSTIASLLEEAVKDYMRDSIDGGDEEEPEIKDDEQDSAEEGVDNGEAETADAEVADDANKEFPEVGDSENVEDAAEAEDGEGAAEDGEDNAEDGDEWSEFDKFKVDDNTYDLTGEKDYDSVVKVYKLLKDEDNVVVKKDGDKITLKDDANDAEYVIDLGTDDDECEGEECEGDALQEGCMEGTENIACLPKTMNENKKCKAMKNKKETIFEVDLGYTDNYQKQDPIEGLSVNEPGKGENLDKGIPTDAKKPWAGKKAKSAGAPYGEKAINEDKNVEITNDESMKPINDLDEAAMSVSSQSVAKETHTPTSEPRAKNARQGAKLVHAAGAYQVAESVLAKSEAILKENKELKETLVKVKSALQEALMVNVNLGKVTKLFLENTTTQKEKIDIINRFNNEAKTIDQANVLYESIKRELNKDTKQNLTLEGKSMSANGSEMINENKIYESQELLNIKDFMKRMGNC